MFLYFFLLSWFSFGLMALKKFIPSKNLIRHRGSSSSLSIPNFVRFHDEKARDDFYENFFNRVIQSKCQVSLFDFSDTPLPGVFSFQGWKSFCEKPKRRLGVFIHEFYSNMHVIDTYVPKFTTVFRGTRIVVTLELIYEVLHVPRVDPPDYPSHRRLNSVS